MAIEAHEGDLLSLDLELLGELYGTLARTSVFQYSYRREMGPLATYAETHGHLPHPWSDLTAGNGRTLLEALELPLAQLKHLVRATLRTDYRTITHGNDYNLMLAVAWDEKEPLTPQEEMMLRGVLRQHSPVETFKALEGRRERRQWNFHGAVVDKALELQLLDTLLQRRSDLLHRRVPPRR